MLQFLYQDEHLVVINKPSGLLVHRGGAPDRVVAMTLVRDRVGRHVHPVHRIDRGASGALLFALDGEVAAGLGRMFQEGGMEKRYLALVRGVPPDRGVIDHPVPRSEGGPRVPAWTEFRRLHVFEGYSLVEAVPRTGRFHQIRRHLKHLSHPIIGDVNYGRSEHNRHVRERFGLRRLALHAAVLGFTHPVTGERLRIEAPLMEDLRGPFAMMGWS